MPEADYDDVYVKSVEQLRIRPGRLPGTRRINAFTDAFGDKTMTYSSSKMLVWTLLFIAPSLSLADTEIVDIGSQRLARMSGAEFTESESTPSPPKNVRLGPATPNAANAEEEDDCD